jgi:hypothetical protein
MIHYPHQGLRNSHSSKPRRKLFYHHDQFFHLPTVIAENDPFLRRVYSAVSLVLDDHPYPVTQQDFTRRTYEIQQNLRELNFSPSQLKFLDRLMTETRVNLVSLLTIKKNIYCFLSQGRSLARFSYNHTR